VLTIYAPASQAQGQDVVSVEFQPHASLLGLVCDVWAPAKAPSHSHLSSSTKSCSWKAPGSARAMLALDYLGCPFVPEAKPFLNSVSLPVKRGIIGPLLSSGAPELRDGMLCLEPGWDPPPLPATQAMSPAAWRTLLSRQHSIRTQLPSHLLQWLWPSLRAGVLRMPLLHHSPHPFVKGSWEVRPSTKAVGGNSSSEEVIRGPHQRNIPRCGGYGENKEACGLSGAGLGSSCCAVLLRFPHP
jgi:hypothetical protein